MIEKPDEDNVVWVRVLKDGVDNVEGSEGRLDRGGIYVCRWSAVRERVLAGDVEII
jgi:GINS complex subunit 4